MSNSCTQKKRKDTRACISTASRSGSGATTMLLALVITVMVILPLGILAFECDRVNFAREQLRVATDAAALAAATARASCAELDGDASASQIQNVALTLFQKNMVMGTQLNDTAISADPFHERPGVGKAFLKIEIKDKKATASASMGIQPVFGAFLGLGPITINATSTAGPGKIDLVFCLDISNSMAADTMVVTLLRSWDPQNQKIRYQVVNALTGKHVDVKVGKGGFPQDIELVNGNGTFQPKLRSFSGIDQGSPPGDYDPSNPGIKRPLKLSGNKDYTDVVVDIPAEALSADSQYFGAVAGLSTEMRAAVLAEALRGNLESEEVFSSSKADTVLRGIVAPQAGFQKRYLQLAIEHTQPFYDAVKAVAEFHALMKENADMHFGLVPFAGRAAGEHPEDVVRWWKVSMKYKTDGKGAFPLPLVSLNPDSDSNYEKIVNEVLPSMVPLFGTDSPGSLKQAIKMLNHNSRDGAKRAIVLLTDGLPYYPMLEDYPLNHSPAGNEAATQDIYQQADRAGANALSIYSIGFFHEEHGDSNGPAVLRTVTRKAGNDSQFYTAHKVQDLHDVFRNIARRLVTLIE